MATATGSATAAKAKRYAVNPVALSTMPQIVMI